MRNIGDRRQVDVELAAKGSALYPRVTEIVAAVNRQFLDGFSPSRLTSYSICCNAYSPTASLRLMPAEGHAIPNIQLRVLSPHGIK
jgi:hypothetical protein